MKGLGYITSVLSFLVFIRLGDALKCLNCDNVAHPALCKHVTTCYADEECGMKTFISTDGARLYSLGCYDTHFCAAGASLHAGSGQAFYSCQTCCDDHDLCNIRGCNATGFPENRGPVCYNCEASPAGFNCPTIEYCEGHEVCYSEATLEFLSQTFYSSGCRSKHHCAGNSFDPLTSFVGKRDDASASKTNTNSETADVHKRSLKVCTDCCESDMCNIQCKQSDSCHDDSSCSTLMASIPDICLNQVLAEKFCQRTCNLCPSLSSSSCGDLRVDCAYINKTNCDSYLKAYTSGCLKHCGFCSGSTAPPTVPIVTAVVHGPTQSVTNAPPTSTVKTSTMRPTTTTVPSTAKIITTSTIRTTSLPSTVVTTATPTSSKPTPSPQVFTMAPTAVTTDAPTTPDFTFPLHPVFIHRTTAPNPTTTVVPVNRVYTNGSRVQRGSDWKGGNEDDNGEGTIVDTSVPGLVTVIWDNGNRHSYNMGKDGEYELAVIVNLDSTTATPTQSTVGSPSTGKPVSSSDMSTSTSSSSITSPATTVVSVKTSTSFNNIRSTEVTTPVPMSTVTVKANCPLTPPNVTHGFPTEVHHDFIQYRCYAGYMFEPVSPNNSQIVYCDSASQTWTKPLPTCIAKSDCTDSTDCLRNGTCDMTAHHCKCAPGYFNTNCDTTLRNGDLVVRGPDWRWGDQDGNNTGRIIPSPSNKEGWVRVQWKNTAFENSYRFGVDGKYDIIPYNSSYIVPNIMASGGTATASIVSGTTTTAVPTYGPALLDKMCVGCRVIRGRDWQWGDQDSNGLGTVRSVDKVKGWVRVEWDSGLSNSYRMGADNAYDIMLAP